MKSFDFLIIGSGIVGLSLARQLRISFGSSVSIGVLEKEDEVGRHSSGRNSGVMHSGIYYAGGTLKARVCGAGAREMMSWCEERGLPVLRCGKVLVPARVEDAPQIDVLLERASQNGVEARRLDREELAELEPEARSATGDAIWCPGTSVIDPRFTLRRIADELVETRVSIMTGQAFLGLGSESDSVVTAREQIRFGHLINAAGLHADKVAHAFGVGRRYVLLPFRGAYWKLSPNSGLNIRHLV